ncbi:sulfatase-like hydrolase/transferase [Halomicroarcula sp. F13]|uniref:Sulfatase-like hydrolase/transferase n=1 Tax=Haloarcula rubra TaxID=2487747 RepID=A0AAW4PSC0_9EURY|nr:sulfatase [Halomicroarcula rubra]MBX0324032.1 sulfatase-like hydrolase/transferase [Halomicroarcula rubra]
MPTVLLTVDSLRADHLKQYGYERDTMPVLDRLTAEGTTFENAFSNGPYTRISIPSFHTSRYLSYGDLGAFPTIASVLSSAGVQTTAIGTQTGIDMVQGEFRFDEMVDLGRDDFEDGAERSTAQKALLQLDSVAADVSDWLQHHRLTKVYDFLQRPYNAMFGDADTVRLRGYNSAEEVTDRAISWIQDNEHEEFFLWLHYMEAHRPYGIHDTDPAYCDEPADDEEIRRLMKTAGQTPEAISEAETSRMIDRYDSDLRYCSRHISRLFDSFEQADIWDDLNILFSSDHGEEFGEHGLFFHRNFPYDELTHVPLILKPARTPPTDTIVEQRELLDLVPTICSFHDVDTDDYSFLGTPLYEGDGRDVISLGQPGMDVPAVTIRTGDWKYIHTESDKQLYDLTSDPGEQTNVIDSNQRVAARLQRKIPQRLFGRDTKTPRPPKDQPDKEQLEALGYLELREDE